jgi:F420H(2)-dependent quinone reductase
LPLPLTIQAFDRPGLFHHRESCLDAVEPTRVVFHFELQPLDLRDPPGSFTVVNHRLSSSYAWLGHPSREYSRPRFTYGARAGTTRNKGDPSTMPLIGEYEPSTSDWAREQTERFEKSGGTEGNTLRGMPIIVMTSVGARSGKLRKTPLMRVEQYGEYAVVASLGGAPNHPVWYHNLKKNPHVELQDGPVKRDYRAREVTGEEKAAWWERAVAAYPDYADYQKKTTREIPVFVLTPMTEAESA